jgi:hypothetical protein
MCLDVHQQNALPTQLEFTTLRVDVNFLSCFIHELNTSSCTYMNKLNVVFTLNEMQCFKLHKWLNFVVTPSIHD